MAQYLKTKADFDEALNKDQLVVVNFTNTWAPDCEMIAPKFEELAKEFEGSALFYKVDMDENGETANKCAIIAMPTFHFYWMRKKVHQIEGADFDGVRAKVMELKD